MPRAAHVFAILILLLARPLVAQNVDCPPPAAILAPDNPVYADATKMQQTLESHGLVVLCIFPTKLGSIFRVEENGVLHSTVEGEADFRTTSGDIDVVFLPKHQTFADFKITERRQDHGYLYRFTGTPRVWAGDQFKFGTAYRQCFLKFDNQLVILNCDSNLHARLEDVLGHTPHLYFERMR